MNRRALAFLALAILAFALFLIYFNSHKRSVRTRSGFASSSGLAYANALIADSNGILYLNEETRNRVMTISADRKVNIAAGNGRAGKSGDGGPADQAMLASPTSIALDPDDNLFIADTGNNAIRRIDARTHIITTLPGDYFEGEWIGEIAGSTATSSGSYPPISIAAYSNENLYLAISHAGGILHIDAIGGAVTKVVGPGLTGDPSAPVANLGPYWVAVDYRGTLYYTDPERNTISQANPLQNDVHRMAGGGLCGFAGDGGPASGALLCFPEAIVAGSDSLFVVDAGNNRIRKIDLKTGIITTVAGNGRIGYAGDGGPGIHASLRNPAGVAVSKDNFVYILDAGNQCIRRLNQETGIITTWLTDNHL
jgi:sugar lactone lactonase YvrE